MDLLAQDNLEFFTANSEKLNTVSQFLDEATNSPDNATYAKLVSLANRLSKLIDRSPPGGRMELERDLRKVDFSERVFIYARVRAGRNHVTKIARYVVASTGAHIARQDALKKELNDILSQVAKLVSLRDAEKACKIQRHGYNVFQEDYSLGCSLPPQQLLNRRKKSSRLVGCKDATKTAGGTFDVVITDPPYGFNTSEDELQLTSIYSNSLREMIRSLRNGGQLVICLPDRSYTGRRLPPFANRRWITSQVISEAQQARLEAVVEARNLPRPESLFRAPYYWESDRALRRVVLHFRLQKMT
jgi:SAM-dependent methyltransferase